MLEDAKTLDPDCRADASAEEWASVPVEARAPAKGKARLLSIDDLDRRTRAAQHCQATRNAILADLGGADGLSTLERCLADHVAILDAVARDIGYRWLAGETVDPGAFCAVVNTLRRAGGSLGWRRRARPVGPSLTELLNPTDEADNG